MQMEIATEENADAKAEYESRLASRQAGAEIRTRHAAIASNLRLLVFAG